MCIYTLREARHKYKEITKKYPAKPCPNLTKVITNFIIDRKERVVKSMLLIGYFTAMRNEPQATSSFDHYTHVFSELMVFPVSNKNDNHKVVLNKEQCDFLELPFNKSVYDNIANNLGIKSTNRSNRSKKSSRSKKYYHNYSYSDYSYYS
jgi:hypothetical protein